MSPVRIATRASALAHWQADHVAGLLIQAGVSSVEIVAVSTAGDRDTSSPLHSIGGKGIFCKEIQAAVLDGRADLAVHSAKDLPAITPPGLVLAAVPQRGASHDCLVGSSLSDLGPGALVGTGSVRRRAQLRRHRPDLVFGELRGNIATRLAKADQFDAIVVAEAALERLGLGDGLVVEAVSAETMVPQVGQGGLAIECRAADDELRVAVEKLEHAVSSRCVRAERAFLAELGGDCSMPAAAHARETDTGGLEMVGFLATEDLSHTSQIRLEGTDGEALGVEMANQVRGDLGL